MKKIIIPVILFTLFLSLYAQVEEYSPIGKMSDIGKTFRNSSRPALRTSTYDWEMGFNPIIANDASYWDYMVGTYNSTPFHKQPDNIGGGYYYSYMGKSSSTAVGRAHYGYMDSDYNIQNDDTFSLFNRLEWFPDSVIDANGKMLICYHSDSDNDGSYEQHYGYDPFFANIPGIPSSEIDLIDNPIQFNGVSDNYFTWGQIKVGESPLGSPYQRVYILTRNRVSHSVIDEQTGSPKPSENPYIAYADYVPDDLDFGNALTWSYTSIPTLNAWNVDDVEWRRPLMAFYLGTGALEGKLFYMGSAVGDLEDGEDNFYVFIHDNYGNPDTEWRQLTFNTDYPLENPQDINNNYYFVDEDNNNAPYTLHWGIVNTNHFNITVDQDNNLHMPATFCVNSQTGSYFIYFHNVKDIIFNTSTETLDIVDVFPQSSNPNAMYNPWDEDGDGSVDQYWDDGTYDDIDDGITPDSEDYGKIRTNTLWPFLYWDKDSHEEAMFFHLNLLKMTNANEHGVMAMMWHDSKAAVDYNESDLSYWEPYAEQSELYVAVSGDNGHTWQPPYALSSVDVADDFWYTDDGQYLGFSETHEYVPEWENMRPQYVTPCPDIEFMGTEDNNIERHRMLMFFYDDPIWGSSEHAVGLSESGQVVINAIDFLLPESVDNDEEINTLPAITEVSNYPNPFNPETTIKYSIKNSGNVKLSVYNLKGQKIETLVNENQNPGEHTIVWDAANHASGIYFYKLQAGTYTRTKKMILMK